MQMYDADKRSEADYCAVINFENRKTERGRHNKLCRTYEIEFMYL